MLVIEQSGGRSGEVASAQCLRVDVSKCRNCTACSSGQTNCFFTPNSFNIFELSVMLFSL